MDGIRAVACNYRIPTKVCKRGAKAFVLSTNPGNGSDRISVMARSRGGRWVEKYEDSRYLHNFRVVTLMACHPACERVGLWGLAEEPWCAEWLAMMNAEEYYGGAKSPHHKSTSVWLVASGPLSVPPES